MRKLIVLTAVLGVSVQICVPVLEACGAKFLAVSRSPRFQRAQHTTRPANILLYQHDPNAGVAEFMAKLQDVLIGFGHRVTIVTSEPAVRDVASRNDFNVVMTSVDAARRLRTDLKSWSPRAVILPMQSFVTKAQGARLKDEFGQILALPTTDRHLFSVVDAAYH
jgi:hypothetical protein